MKDSNLIIHTGPMFSGKSSHLLTDLSKYQVMGVPVILIIPTIASSSYNTHGCVSCNIPIVHADKLSSVTIPSYDTVIGIDEGHFFPDLYDVVVRWIEKEHRQVIMAGLITTYHRTPFPQTTLLLNYADMIYYHTALCTICSNGTSGIFSCRLTNDKEELLVGSDDKYTVVCRKHFIEKNEVSQCSD